MKLNSKTIFLGLTILIACIFIWPELNFQDKLSQGDHGRDLYAFDAVTHGQLPYKDFWWVYGPLMPYYYGLFFKIFGVHITSVLLGRAILSVVCAVLFYLAACCIMPSGLACLAAVWFTQSRQEFFFTYNHIGGIAMELLVAWCLLSYIRNNSIRYLWISLIAVFILGLVKINFGVAGLAGLVLCVAGIDWFKKSVLNKEKKIFYGAAGGVFLLWVIINWLLLHDLPLYAIRQCMPYFGDDQPYHASPLMVIPYFFLQHFMTLVRTPLGIPIGIILHGSTLYAAYLLIRNKLEKKYREDILLSLGVIGVFFVFYFHEFLVSGVWYRTYWSYPFLSLFHFVTISVAFRYMPKFLRIIIVVFFCLVSTMTIVSHIGSIEAQKKPWNFLHMDRGRIYVGNEPQWTDTVNRVTDYLSTTMGPDETFFALPYDCLYYYLTGKPSPTRQLIFFDHIKIPTEQEISVIQELEIHKNAYVLMSSRIISPEWGLGIFGKTYCPLLAKYIQDTYKPLIRQGGDWSQPPGWADNHGVIILKRK